VLNASVLCNIMWSMKKCYFCAEEVQDQAIICRFCNRKISPGHIWFTKIKYPVYIFIILLIIGVAVINRDKISKNIKSAKMAAKQFSGEVKTLWNEALILIKDVHEGIKSARKYRGGADTIRQMERIISYDTHGQRPGKKK